MLRSDGGFRLELNDLHLTEQDQLHPFVGHPLHALKCGDRVEYLASEVVMRPEEVVAGDP